MLVNTVACEMTETLDHEILVFISRTTTVYAVLFVFQSTNQEDRQTALSAQCLCFSDTLLRVCSTFDSVQNSDGYVDE